MGVPVWADSLLLLTFSHQMESKQAPWALGFLRCYSCSPVSYLSHTAFPTPSSPTTAQFAMVFQWEFQHWQVPRDGLKTHSNSPHPWKISPSACSSTCLSCPTLAHSLSTYLFLCNFNVFCINGMNTGNSCCMLEQSGIAAAPQNGISSLKKGSITAQLLTVCTTWGTLQRCTISSEVTFLEIQEIVQAEQNPHHPKGSTTQYSPLQIYSTDLVRQMQAAGTCSLIKPLATLWSLSQRCRYFFLPHTLPLNPNICHALKSNTFPIPQHLLCTKHCCSLAAAPQDIFLRSKNKLVTLFDSQELNEIGSRNYFLDYLIQARLLSKYFDMRRFVKINRQSASHC